MFVQQCTIGAVGWLCWYSRVLFEHPGCCSGKQSTIGSTIRALRKLCCYKRVLQGHWRGCVGTAEYYRSTRDAVSVQKSTLGELERLC